MRSFAKMSGFFCSVGEFLLFSKFFGSSAERVFVCNVLLLTFFYRVLIRGDMTGFDCCITFPIAHKPFPLV